MVSIVALPIFESRAPEERDPATASPFWVKEREAPITSRLTPPEKLISQKEPETCSLAKETKISDETEQIRFAPGNPFRGGREGDPFSGGREGATA